MLRIVKKFYWKSSLNIEKSHSNVEGLFNGYVAIIAISQCTSIIFVIFKCITIIITCIVI